MGFIIDIIRGFIIVPIGAIVMKLFKRNKSISEIMDNYFGACYVIGGFIITGIILFIILFFG